MSEVEKMYENVEPNRDCNLYKHFTECPMKHTQCEDCENFVYPPFTAEKQLRLENFLLEDSKDKTFTQFEMLKTIENKFLYVYRFSENNLNLKRFDTIGETRQECLAGLINNLWQDLTEEERKQIKEILE